MDGPFDRDRLVVFDQHDKLVVADAFADGPRLDCAHLVEPGIGDGPFVFHLVGTFAVIDDLDVRSRLDRLGKGIGDRLIVEFAQGRPKSEVMIRRKADE